MTDAVTDAVTEAERRAWPRTVKVALPPSFEDARGVLQPLVDLPMRSAVLIDSTAGSVRANHCHRTDWHFCLVLEGRMHYFHRPHASAAPPEEVVVEAGEMVFTPPMVDHAMRFPVPTRFLTLARNPRDQASYEADLIRVSLIPDP